MISCQHFLKKKKPACLQASFDCQRSCADRLCDFVTLFSSQISPDNCIGGMKYMRFSDKSNQQFFSIKNSNHLFLLDSSIYRILALCTIIKDHSHNYRKTCYSNSGKHFLNARDLFGRAIKFIGAVRIDKKLHRLPYIYFWFRCSNTRSHFLFHSHQSPGSSPFSAVLFAYFSIFRFSP